MKNNAPLSANLPRPTSRSIRGLFRIACDGGIPLTDHPSQNSVPDFQAEPLERRVGQGLHWNVETVPVVLIVELPFWLMMPDASLDIEIHGHVFSVDIRDGFHEIFVVETTDSRRTRIYIGPPDDDKIDPEIRRLVEENDARFIARKCKTVLQIHSLCNPAILAAEASGTALAGEAQFYLRAFCAAHLDVVNRLVQSYRLASFDFFPHEVTPWDVPIWLVKSRGPATQVALLPYATWDDKPLVGPIGDPTVSETYQLIAPEALAVSLQDSPSPGEFELLDAINLMERGDYSGAVRRIATAIEVLTEAQLRTQLQEQGSTDQQIRDRLFRVSGVNRRIESYAALSGRDIPQEDFEDWKEIQKIRHRIVHNGYRIDFGDRCEAQEAWTKDVGSTTGWRTGPIGRPCGRVAWRRDQWADLWRGQFSLRRLHRKVSSFAHHLMKKTMYLTSQPLPTPSFHRCARSWNRSIHRFTR